MVVNETGTGTSNGGFITRPETGRPDSGRPETGRPETDRPETGQSLRAKAALLDAQMEASTDGILAVSPQGRILGVNRRFCEIWSLTLESVQPGAQASEVVSRMAGWVYDGPALTSMLLGPASFAQDSPPGQSFASGDSATRRSFDLMDGRTVAVFQTEAIDEHGAFHGRVWLFRDDAAKLATDAGVSDLLARLAAAERTQGYLLTAMNALAGASGYVETVERLADVALPVLGDLFLIDVLDERQRAVRVLSRHVDRSKQPLADRLRYEFAPAHDGLEPTLEVMRTGKSHWSRDMSDDFLRKTTQNHEHYELARELGYTSYLCVPLFYEERVLGSVTLISAGSGRRYTPDDLALVELLAYPVAQVVSRGLRYDRQRGIARSLQTSLLPSSVPDLPGLSVATRDVAGTWGADVGGDFYDVIRMPSGAIGMMIGDVAGHDPAAAAAMGQVRAASRALAGQVRTPAQLVALMRSSWELIGIDRMATVIYGRLDPRTGELCLSSAGHPPPVLVTGQKARVVPLSPEPPLGAPGEVDPLPVPPLVPERIASSDSPNRPVAAPRGDDAINTGWFTKMSNGDVLVLYTDGLVERRDRPVQDGISALEQLVQDAWDGDPEALCDVIIQRLASAPDRSDDVALMVISLASKR